MHVCEVLHVCVCVCVFVSSGAGVPSKPVMPERVGGFPVDFLRQVVGFFRTVCCNMYCTYSTVSALTLEYA